LRTIGGTGAGGKAPRGDSDARREPLLVGLARRQLLLWRQLGAVHVADEARARPARAVGATLDAADHVERARALHLLRRQAHHPIGRDLGGQLSLGGEPLVALDDALHLRDGELARVLAAEPAVARARARISAARDRAEPPAAPQIGLATRVSRAPSRARLELRLERLERLGDPPLDLGRDDLGELFGDAIDHRAQRQLLVLQRHER